MRLLWVWLAACVLCISAKLIANKPFEPKSLNATLLAKICVGRNDCIVYVDVPEKCATDTTTSCPIMFGFHGYGGTADEWYSKTNAPLRTSDMLHTLGIIGVFPQGDKHTGPRGDVPAWDDGNPTLFPANKCKYTDYECTLDPNDTLWISQIITQLRVLGALGNIYAYGLSMGSGMAQRVGANANPTTLPIKGIAANSMQLYKTPVRSCGVPLNYNVPQPSITAPVAQLSLHGTADGNVPFNGGESYDPHFLWYSEADSNVVWSTHNKCDASPPSQTTLNATATELAKTTATHYVFQGCPATAPVEWYAIEKAGHCQTLSLGGRNTTQVVLEFFLKVEKALAKDTGGLTPLQGSLIGVGAMAAAVLTSYVVTLYKKNVAADADANQLQDGGHADVKVMAHVATGDGIDVPYQRVENE